MRHLLLGGSVVASLISAGCGVALAAPPTPIWSWTGFYLGANVGYSWGRSNSTVDFRDTASGVLLSSATAKADLDGVIGGGQFGYNWQHKDWLFGLEADIQGSAQTGSAAAACAGGSLGAPPASLFSACAPGHIGDTTPNNVAALPVFDTLSQSLDWFGTVRGRIGPTITPTIVGYVTGGLAYGQVSTTNTVSGTNLVGPQGVNGVGVFPVAASATNTAIQVGWTIGAGVEGALRDNWTCKIEYLHVDLGHVKGSFVTPVIAPSGAFVTSSYNSHITDEILRVGINYKLP
jgi:outer membrane immunogenic protein